MMHVSLPIFWQVKFTAIRRYSGTTEFARVQEMCLPLYQTQKPSGYVCDHNVALKDKFPRRLWDRLVVTAAGSRPAIDRPEDILGMEPKSQVLRAVTKKSRKTNRDRL